MENKKYKLEDKVKEDRYKGHRFHGDALVYKGKSGFHPIEAIKNFLYDLYHPVNYSK